jgi:LPS-assembly protein
MTAAASGHVVMTVGRDVLTGDRVQLDLANETGILYDGSVFLEDSHFTIRGQRIEKTGRNTYRAEKGSVTTCGGDRPDWVITGRTVKVTIEGYGSATHAVFRARDLPLLYTPYILFPAKTQRQTGLLMPEFGHSSRKGASWEQPFFWAINESSDASVTTHYMQKRGTNVGLEYRYALTDDSYGTIMANGLKDRQVDDGTADNSADWGYTGDAYDRPNQDRYWLRAKLDQQLPWQAHARLDLDIVSDQDYLTEFKDGLNGFTNSRTAFLNGFDRDIDPYDETTRKNRLNVNRMWSSMVFNGDLVWNDNVTNRRWEESDDTVQELPVLRLDAVRRQVAASVFFWDLGSDYRYGYREDGERGHRMEVYPRAYLPLAWGNYLSVEPSAGWRQTVWHMDRQDDPEQDRTEYRQIFDAQLDLSTELAAVMGSPVRAYDRIRHTIRPQVTYAYVPDQDQSDVPDLIELDRIDEQNRITYALTNTFMARTVAPPSAAAPGDDAAATPSSTGNDGGQATGAPQYHRLGRLYLAQSWDIAAARENASRTLSDLYGELDLYFGRYLTLNADASFDTYDTRFSSYSTSASVANRRGDRLRVVHSYETGVKKSIRTSASVNLTGRLAIRGEYERNLLTRTDITKGIGFLYRTGCWSLNTAYAREGDDDKFTVAVDLTGIGGFGQ